MCAHEATDLTFIEKTKQWVGLDDEGEEREYDVAAWMEKPAPYAFSR